MILRFLESLIPGNLMLDFENSKWRTWNIQNDRIWIKSMILRFLKSLIPNLMLDFQNSKCIQYGGPKWSNYQFSLTYPNTSIFYNLFTLNLFRHIRYIKIEFSNFKNLNVMNSIKIETFLIILVSHIGSAI